MQSSNTSKQTARNPPLLLKRISAAVGRLKKSPGIGLPGRVEGTRELVIDRTPYVAAYQIAGNAVGILRVLHGAQQWPEELPVE